VAELTFIPTADAYMDGKHVDTNYPNTTINAGKHYTAGAKDLIGRGLIKFDVSALAGLYQSIDAAQLELFVDFASAVMAGHIHRVRRAWTENGVTWNKWNGTDLWTAAGADDTTNDRDDTTPGTVAFNAGSINNWQTISGMLGYVTDAITNRANIVNILLQGDDETDDGINHYVFWREREHTNFEPVLRVTYTPIVVTEPARRASIRTQGGRPARPAAPDRPAAAARPFTPGRPR
jgi:hypothetical protein